MSYAIPIPVLFRLLAALEVYRSEMEALLRCMFCVDSARRLARALMRVAALTSAVPSLAADVAEISLHHRQLMRALRLKAKAARPALSRRLERIVGTCDVAVRSACDKCTNLLLG